MRSVQILLCLKHALCKLWFIQVPIIMQVPIIKQVPIVMQVTIIMQVTLLCKLLLCNICAGGYLWALRLNTHSFCYKKFVSQRKIESKYSSNTKHEDKINIYLQNML